VTEPAGPPSTKARNTGFTEQQLVVLYASPWLVTALLGAGVYLATLWSVPAGVDHLSWPSPLVSVVLLASSALPALINVISYRRYGGSPRVTDASMFVVTASGAVGLSLLFALPPLLSGGVYTYGDLANFFLPIRSFYADCLASGDDFSWWPDLFCGFNLHGDGQGGLYHPAHWLLYRLLPLEVAFGLEVTAAYPVVYAGLVFFLRRWGLGWGAASLGGLIFSFGGPLFLRFNLLNGVWITAHLPWLLLLLDLSLRDPAPRRLLLTLPALALLTASQVLLGGPQYLFFSLLVEALYVLLVLTRGRPLGSLGLVVLAKLTGAALGALQLIPTWEALLLSSRVPPSVRGYASPDMANALHFAFPYALPGRVAPHSQPWNGHELSVYLGLAPLLLCVVAIARRRRSPAKSLQRFAIALTLGAGLLAVGENTPLFTVLAEVTPIGMFRQPVRYMLLAAFGFAVLAALAAQALLDDEVGGEDTKWPIPLLAAGVGILALGLSASHRLDLNASSALLALVPALLAIGAWRARRCAPWLVALAGVQLVDLAAYDLSFIRHGGLYDERGAPVPIGEIPLPLPREVLPQSAEGRVAADRRWSRGSRLNRLTLHGVALVGGYAGIPPQPLDVADARARAAARVRLRQTEGRWERSAGPLPSAWVATLSTAPPQVTAETWLLPSTDSAATARLVHRTNAVLTVEVATPTAGLLVLSEAHSPGWRAQVDGRPTEVRRLNQRFLGCAVPAGAHQVIFRFEPPGLRAGVTLAWCGLLALLLLPALAYGHERRQGHCPRPG
jgi:hypothetical protein